MIYQVIIGQRVKFKIPPPPTLNENGGTGFYCSSNTDWTGIWCLDERPLGTINCGNTQQQI